MTANFIPVTCPHCGNSVLTNAATTAANFPCPECGGALPPPAETPESATPQDRSMEDSAIAAMRRATLGQQTRTMPHSGPIPVAAPAPEIPPPDTAEDDPIATDAIAAMRRATVGGANTDMSDSQSFAPPPAPTCSQDMTQTGNPAIDAMRQVVDTQRTRTMTRSGRVPIAIPEPQREQPSFPSHITAVENEPTTAKIATLAGVEDKSKTFLNDVTPRPLKEQEPEKVVTPRPVRTGLTTIAEFEKAIEEQKQANAKLAQENAEFGRRARNAEMERQIHEENCELLRDQVSAAFEQSGLGRFTRRASELEEQIKDAELEKKRVIDEAQRQFKRIKEEAERAVRTGVGQATGQFKVKIQDDAAGIPEKMKDVKNEMDEIRALMKQRIREIAAKVDENDQIRDEIRRLEDELGIAATQRQAAEGQLLDLERGIEGARLRQENQQVQEAASALRLEVADLMRQATDARSQLISMTGDDTIPPVPEPKTVEPEQPKPQEHLADFGLADFELDVDISLDLDDLMGGV